MENKTIIFVPSGRGKSQCPPDPNHPNGIDVDIASHSAWQVCDVTLPYPAPERGYWRIDCRLCQLAVAIIAAGRPDDPRSARIPCRITTESR